MGLPEPGRARLASLLAEAQGQESCLRWSSCQDPEGPLGRTRSRGLDQPHCPGYESGSHPPLLELEVCGV